MYQVIRQKRKTMTLSIDDTLSIIIKVPYYVKDKEIKQFVLNNKEWIEQAIKNKKDRLAHKDWVSKGEINYLGRTVKVEIVESNTEKKHVDYTENGFKITIDDIKNTIKIREMLEHYLKEEAYKRFVTLTNAYCKQLGCAYNKISVRKQKTRWGSCSSKGNLSYNIKLIGAPEEVMAYVVLHEVVHLIHFNHSKAFWETIENIMPDYRLYQAYLKKYGMYLEI